MATLSADKKSVTVQRGDTLWDIAARYLGSGTKYKQLAAINNISNPSLIYVGQVIKLEKGSGSGSGSSSSSTTQSNMPTITAFGLSSVDNGMLFATWTWSKSNTASYKVLWTYDTGDGVWFSGNGTTITVDKDAPELSRQSTYNIPTGAKKVRFKVKPISETYTKNKKETNYWTADWSTVKTYTDSTPLDTPSTPSIDIDKYQLTATLDNVAIDATGIEFEVVKDNSAKSYKTGKATIVTGHVSFSCTVDAGGEYKVRCRAYKGDDLSEWSAYSNNVESIPATPLGITTLRTGAETGTSAYLEWEEVPAADTYDIEYTTNKNYFDGSDQTTTKTGVEFTHYEINGLETGTEYFFRIRAVNAKGHSPWSEIKSVVLGKTPGIPTTWSSTTTAITGEILNLYWIHNSEDGSSQTYADLELWFDGQKETHTIQNSTDEEEKDKTSFYAIDTSSYLEGTKIEWRVRTSGITRTYGDWSIKRTVDVYAPPTLSLTMIDGSGNQLSTLASFPCYISGLAGPNTQVPTGYHMEITSNEVYETIDNVGNTKLVNAGDSVYSKYFDTYESLMVELSASNIDLENNVTYTVTGKVSMNSGLTAQSSFTFTVAWDDETYSPNAEIGIDEDTLSAYVRPYCDIRSLVTRRVIQNRGLYTVTDEVLSGVYGEVVRGAKTSTGQQVYSGVDEDNTTVYFCEVEELVPVTDVLLSVYRREFDGSFIELATDLDGAKSTTITDPHPALDYARYRIVATSKTTGAVSYYDPPGYPVGGIASVIQWDEDWTSFETTEEDGLEQPPWSGSMLKLMYNIDVSDSNSPDVSLIEYIGREHPVGYYGTHLGQTSSWNMDIEKSDKETLYALRRLQRWMGNVYVREPSGSGYWANVTVSFSQKHMDLTIPVTLSIKRVEGGA